MMCSTEIPQKSCPSKIVKLNNALNLAEKWVSNMSQASWEEPTEVEGRPSRLGLGAKVCRQSKVGPLNSPLEKKLYAKLSARNKSAEKSSPALKDGCDSNDDDDNEDEDSRTSVFNKKRAAEPLTPLLRENKKNKMKK